MQGISADLKQTLDGARTAMVGFDENMEALKRNFLVRGFFNGRGYFDLDDISPAAYRQGCADHGRRTSVGPRLAARRCAVRAGVLASPPASG